MWGILLPVLATGLVLAYVQAPQSLTEELRRAPQPEALAETIAFAEDELLKVNVRASGDSVAVYQAEFVLKMPLMQPSAAIYLASDAAEQNLAAMTALGTLGPQGVYRMALPGSARGPWHFVLYDFVKQSIWHRITVNR